MGHCQSRSYPNLLSQTHLLPLLGRFYGVLGKYYAVEDMLTTDPSEKFGTITLQEHYDRIAVEGQEYDPYTTMVSGHYVLPTIVI